MLRSALRFAAGAALAGCLWFFLTPAYHMLLATAVQPLVRIDGRLRHAEVRAMGADIEARGNEREPHLPRIIIPASQLTYNFLLLAGLFALQMPARRGQAALRVLIAVAVLTLTHVAAVAVSIESAYATQAGAWSEKRYSDPEQDFWTAAEYVYRLAGMFAIAFACWWVAVSDPSADQRSPARAAA